MSSGAGRKNCQSLVNCFVAMSCDVQRGREGVGEIGRESSSAKILSLPGTQNALFPSVVASWSAPKTLMRLKPTGDLDAMSDTQFTVTVLSAPILAIGSGGRVRCRSVLIADGFLVAAMSMAN